jgi:hypothetical protein
MVGYPVTWNPITEVVPEMPLLWNNFIQVCLASITKLQVLTGTSFIHSNQTKNKQQRKVTVINKLIMPFASCLSFLKKKYVDGFSDRKELQKQ